MTYAKAGQVVMHQTAYNIRDEDEAWIREQARIAGVNRSVFVRSLLEAARARAEAETPKEKTRAAVELGHLGGMKGGFARAAALSPQERSEQAQHAAITRWDRKEDSMPKPHRPRLEISISEEVIREASVKDSSHCMIAEAIKAQVANAKHVSVDIQTIRWSDPTKARRHTYLTPRSAQEALIAFDQGEIVAPFSFRLSNAQVTKAGTTNPKLDGRYIPPKTASSLKREGTGKVPARSGGKPPPLAGFARRREFGLRALSR